MSRRLTEALRREGADAKLLVEEKLTDYPFVETVGHPTEQRAAFMAERADIFLHNGFSRKNLFKADTGGFGLPLWKHPLVKGADAVILNWVNQGMLSLKGVEKICRMGKRVVWTMHDMWNFTGICHHALDCRNFMRECGNCFLLGRCAGRNDISHKTFEKKRALYDKTAIQFVAVSNWLAEEARKSALLGGSDIKVIHNPFDISEISDLTQVEPHRKTKTILFSAAQLDNWIKGFATFRRALEIMAEKYPDTKDSTEVVLLGAAKDPSRTENLPYPTLHPGHITSEKEIEKIYRKSDITVNCSSFENLPGTLVEAQAFGSIPVAFDRGGQRDIIEEGKTGFLVKWNPDTETRSREMAEAMAKALGLSEHERTEMIKGMKEGVKKKFSGKEIAKKYIEILDF